MFLSDPRETKESLRVKTTVEGTGKAQDQEELSEHQIKPKSFWMMGIHLKEYANLPTLTK